MPEEWMQPARKTGPVYENAEPIQEDVSNGKSGRHPQATTSIEVWGSQYPRESGVDAAIVATKSAES